MIHRARLGSIGRHIFVPAEASSQSSAGSAAHTATPGLKLLSDGQLQQFLGQGYLTLQV
jgi:hypothetical protein